MQTHSENNGEVQTISALIDDMFFLHCDYISRLCGSGKTTGNNICFELPLASLFTHNLLTTTPKKTVLLAIQKHEKLSFQPEQANLDEIENNLKNYSVIIKLQKLEPDSFLTKIESSAEINEQALREEIKKIGNIPISKVTTLSGKVFFVTFQTQSDADLVKSKLPGTFAFSMVSMPSEVFLSSFSKTKAASPASTFENFYPHPKPQPFYNPSVYYPGLDNDENNFNNNNNNNYNYKGNNNRNRGGNNQGRRNDQSSRNNKQNRNNKNNRNNRRGDYQQQQQQQQQPIQKLNIEPTFFPPLSSSVRSGYPASAPAKQYSLANLQKIVKETIHTSIDQPKSELIKIEGICIAEKPLSNVFTTPFAEVEPESVSSAPVLPKTGTSYADIAKTFSPSKNTNFNSPPLSSFSEKKTIIRKKQIEEEEFNSDDE